MPEYPHTDSERDFLRDYLNQFATAIAEKHRLQRRLSQLHYDMKYPPGRPLQEAPGKRTGHGDQAGMAMHLVEKADGIERRIAEQTAAACDALLCVFDAMDYLPILSVERTVLELRHIDLLRWPAASNLLSLSRSMAFTYYNAGLDYLLEIPEFRARVDVYGGNT